MSYARDTYYRSIEITTDNNRFRVVEDPDGLPNVVYVDVTAGTYHLHDDSSYHDSARGLLYTIKTLLNSGTTTGLGTRSGTPAKTYSWEAITPTSSTGIDYGGLKLTGTGTSPQFNLTWAASNSMDARWFGFATANPGTITSVSGVGSDRSVSSPYCMWGRFVTHDLMDGYAIDKRRKPYKIARTSGPNRADSITLVWQEGHRREFLYTDVPGGLVYASRSAESAYAELAGLSTSDQNHAWEIVWDSLSDGDDVIVVHDSHTNLQIDAHDHELVKLESSHDWESFATPQQSGGDLHSIGFTVWVDTAASDYDH